MPSYKYQGRTQHGQAVSGVMESSNKYALASQLADRGITPVTIDEVTVSDSIIKQINVLLGAERVGTVELIMFARQMYTITKSGIPLTRGLRGLAASIRHEYFKEVVNDIAERLETGSMFSQSLRAYPKVFNHLFVSMIAVGETTGQLDQVFLQIAHYMERDDETRKRVKSALRYPMFVCFALLSAITSVNIWVIPAFAEMFKQFDADLPIVTRILIASSHVFTHYWPMLLVGFALSVVGAVYYIKTPHGAVFWGKYSLRLPVVGGLIQRASMARYARSFSLMLKAGVPITQALNLCADAIDNRYLEQKIRAIREGVERGESLMRTHANANMFTPLVMQMIAVGEESGQVEALLGDVAEFYEREVDYDLKTLTDRIEPILIVVMAIFVLVLALGIFLPMWSMYDIQKS